MNIQQHSQPLLDLGIWLGRKQAFSAVAGRCSAADAECLRQIRESKTYRSLDLTWDQFCKEKVGVTRPVVDKMIRQLEEFGPAFFQLASILRITADEYRLIAGSVAEDGLLYDGEKIAIDAQNTSRLAQAVDALRSQAALPAPDSQSHEDGEPDGESSEECESAFGDAPGEGYPEFARVEKMLFSAINRLTRLSTGQLDTGRRLEIQACVLMARDQLDMIALSTRI
jgi:hypothetical protein